MQNNRGEYPANWKEISDVIKSAAGWKCVRCGHPHEPQAGYTLTVHHLDGDKANCEWWNCPALCQRCHLHIQGRVVMARVWMFSHSEWFKPYLAGYYAHRLGEPEDRASVMAHMDELIMSGRLG